jgi:hypothetical protein
MEAFQPSQFRRNTIEFDGACFHDVFSCRRRSDQSNHRDTAVNDGAPTEFSADPKLH